MVKHAPLGVRQHDIDLVVLRCRQAAPGPVHHVGVNVNRGDLPGLADQFGDRVHCRSSC